MRVFLSYATGDAKIADVVRTRLKAAGHDVWDPAEDASPGDNVALEQGRALERADAFVVLLSPNAVTSPWVQHEIDYALQEKRFKNRLIPVVAKPVQDIPWILKKLNVLTLGHDPKRGSRQIVEALKRSKAAA